VKVKIQDIAYYLPEKILTNLELSQKHPNWNVEKVEKLSGVTERRVASENETALDLALEACIALFTKNPKLSEKVDGIIFCTQSPDYIMPSNAFLLQKELDLSENILAFDFNLACSGYIYGLAIAQGLIISKVARNILLVTSDTYSKYINLGDRSASVLFGDGGAVSWITVSDSSQGIIDIECSSSGKDFKTFYIPAGGCRIPKSKKTAIPIQDENGNIRTAENIHMDGMKVLSFVNSQVTRQIKTVLKKKLLSVEDIELFVFHQGSKLALDALQRIIKIPPEKVFNNIQKIGNTVSASIPIALKDALDQNKISRGGKVVLTGFGVGLSWGTAILEM
jgi:3-oxoacyl-[acyl-carrier-protein] synthase III